MSNMINKILVYCLNQIESQRWKLQYDQFRQTYDIHPSFHFNGPGITLYGKGKIILGENSYIGRYSSLQSSEGHTIKIGNDCAISHYFMVYTENRISNQDFNKKKSTKKGDVIIGDHCWIGANTFIREGITIGDNVVIGAHSVITKDIPSFTIVAGVPARIINRIKK